MQTHTLAAGAWSYPRPHEPRATALIVDHDRGVCTAISDFLGRHGLDVVCAADVAEARLLLDRHDVELLILGQLATMSGMELCRSFQSVVSKPTIVIADEADQMERILALELGADDLLSRPANLRELLARARALLRRSRAPRSPLFTEWTLSGRERALITPDGKPISLTKTEFSLLTAFAGAPSGLLAIDQAEAVFQVRNPASTLRTAVTRLRRKVAEYNGAIIRTISGKGYVLEVVLVQA